MNDLHSHMVKALTVGVLMWTVYQRGALFYSLYLSDSSATFFNHKEQDQLYSPM